MGANTEVLTFVGGINKWWFHLTTPYDSTRNRVVGINGTLSADSARMITHSARPALYNKLKIGYITESRINLMLSQNISTYITFLFMGILSIFINQRSS